jgi:YHS domain-containing protein
MVKDPVCGMAVDPNNAQAKSDYQGMTYYFCSEDCKHQFDSDPKKFVQQSQSGASSR